LNTGGVAVGTSAGTDVMTSKIMITCGDSYEALRNGSSIFWRTMELPITSLLTAFGPGGIGLFPYGLLDTHFANRGRQGRMIRLLADSYDLPSGHTRAFAIDENTALVVTPDGSGGDVGDLIGARGALVLDMSGASFSGSRPQDGSFYPVYNVKATRLSHGDQWDFSKMKLIPAPYKVLLKETNADVYVSSDIFSGDSFEFDQVTTSLLMSTAASSYGITKQSQPAYSLQVSKNSPDGSDTATAKGYGGTDPVTGEFEVSFENLHLNVVQV